MPRLRTAAIVPLAEAEDNSTQSFLPNSQNPTGTPSSWNENDHPLPNRLFVAEVTQLEAFVVVALLRLALVGSTARV
jgi:hypothetical protein